MINYKNLVLIKANFKLTKGETHNEQTKSSVIDEEQKQNLTQDEFEEYIIKSGASGSFIVFRSDRKEDELGLDEL